MLESIEFKADRFKKEEDYNIIEFTENTIILCNNCQLMNTLAEEIFNTVNGKAEYNDYWSDNKDVGKAKLDLCFGLRRVIDINGQKITIGLEPAIIFKANKPEDIWFFDINGYGQEVIYPMLIFKGSRQIWEIGKDEVYKMTCSGQFGCYDGNFVNAKPDMREKVREYIGKLDAEIKRLEDLLIKTDNPYSLQVKGRLETIIDVRQDLQSRLEEVA